MSGPSPYTLEMAMAAVEATLVRLRDAGAINTEIDTDEAALLAALGEEGIEVGHLLERVVSAAVEAEANAAAAGNRINALSTRKQRFDRLAETWRGTALAMMDALGMRTHKAAEFTVTLAAGLPTAVITDEAVLPEEYWRITRTPNRIAIKADLAEGVVIPGAEMSNSPPHLRIKRG